MVVHWRATRSRNSRPELIADDGQGMYFPVCPIPWQRPDRKAGHAPGVKSRNDTVQIAGMHLQGPGYLGGCLSTVEAVYGRLLELFAEFSSRLHCPIYPFR